MGIIVTGLAIYNLYKDNCRRQQLEHTKGHIKALDEIRDYRTNKLLTLQKVITQLKNICQAKPSNHISYQFPTKKPSLKFWVRKHRIKKMPISNSQLHRFEFFTRYKNKPIQDSVQQVEIFNILSRLQQLLKKSSIKSLENQGKRVIFQDYNLAKSFVKVLSELSTKYPDKFNEDKKIVISSGDMENPENSYAIDLTKAENDTLSSIRSNFKNDINEQGQPSTTKDTQGHFPSSTQGSESTDSLKLQVFTP